MQYTVVVTSPQVWIQVEADDPEQAEQRARGIVERSCIVIRPDASDIPDGQDGYDVIGFCEDGVYTGQPGGLDWSDRTIYDEDNEEV
jgi:hypothetical protein